MSSKTLDARLAGLKDQAADAFRSAFSCEPTLFVAAPGRVNLIGEHTDYNDGFVLPAAIDRHAVLALAPRDDRQVTVYAMDLDETTTFSLDDIQYVDDMGWSNYLRGVAWALQEEGYLLQGMDAVLASDVPVASGLSSSAAIEVATAYAFQVISDLELDGVKRALLCQKAENVFVGMNCGIMDQYIVSLGKLGHALLIDCCSLGYDLVPIPDGGSVIICNTKKKRGLVDSAYNTRRAECEAGAEALGKAALRDATMAELQALECEMDSTVYRRCRHVISENDRTLEAVDAMRSGDMARLGALMNASHVSLRDDYEVSCAELDAMVEAAWRQPGVYGARMTGAGFGGCAVALVDTAHAEAFGVQVAAEYEQATGISPEIYICTADDGVHTL